MNEGAGERSTRKEREKWGTPIIYDAGEVDPPASKHIAKVFGSARKRART